MKAFYILCLLFLYHHHVCGRVLKKFLPDQLFLGKNYDDAIYDSSIETENVTAIGGFGIGNESYRTEQNVGSSTDLTGVSSLENQQGNTTLDSEKSSQLPQNSTDSVSRASSPHPETSLSEIFGSESNVSSAEGHSSSTSSSTTTELATKTTGRLENGTTSVSVGSGPAVTSTGPAVNTSSTESEEPEGVARGKPATTESYNTTTSSSAETLYQKTIALINDTYVLSILIPVAAGVVFACTIIITIATCRCLSRRCRRRRLRRKALPDSVKNMRPSDRARLLAETSDEEF